MLFLITTVFAFGQTVQLNQQPNWNLVPSTISFATTDSLGPQEALQQLGSSEFSKIEGSTTFGFSDQFYWIKVPVCNAETARSFILEIDNPHIDRIVAWSVTDQVPEHIGISGDRMPFYQRTIINRRPVFQFDLGKGQCADLLLMVDKRHSAIIVPMVLWNADDFLKNETDQTLIYGIFFGILLLILLYTILIYALQKRPTYLWYGLYVAALGLYLFVYVGFGFQYLYPGSATLNNHSRLVLIVLILVTQIRFTQHFLQLKERAKIINRLYAYLVYLLVAIVSWWLIFPGLFTTYTVTVINLIYVLMGAATVLLTLSLIRTYKHQPSAVVFYAVAFSMNVLAAALVVMEEYGLICLHGLPISPMLLGAFFEVIIFAVGLSYRSRLISDDRERLQLSIKGLKRNAITSYMDGVEEEKKRVAGELHDDIASRLALLKQSLSSADPNSNIKELQDSLSDITERVRAVSHSLNPVALDEDSFPEQVRKLVEAHNSGKLKVIYQAFDLPEKMPVDTGLQLFRIMQEALQNISKHAKATQVDIQLFRHDNELLLAIEDDGIGFDQEQSIDGLGTGNMRKRAEKVGGTMEVSSAVGKGTSIMVSVSI